MVFVTVMMLATALMLQDPSLRGGSDRLPHVPRVRSDDPTVARLIAEATEQSATFRHELELLGRTNGIVWVFKGRCGAHRVHACLVPTVVLSGSFRLLHVQVDLTRSEMETIGSIGHELWHAIEVLTSDPPVTSNAAMVLFFRQLGDGIRFETAAATKAGIAVFDEIREARSRDRLRARIRDPARVGIGATAAGRQPPEFPRLRAEDPFISATIARGAQASATFRRLIDAINASDGLVYIVEGQCGQGVRACLHMSLEWAGPNRLLRILVNLRRAPGCELMTSIGHELQHAVEALSNPSIRTGFGLSSFFHQIGPEGPRRFETTAAQDVELAIAKEAC